MRLMQTRRDWLQQAIVCEFISLRAVSRDDDASNDTEGSSGFNESGSLNRGLGRKAKDFEAQLYACVRRCVFFNVRFEFLR